MSNIFKRPDGTFVHYEYIKRDEKRPGILYLHGLLSSVNSFKATVLKAYAQAHGLSYLAMDFTAHGKSWGNPSDFRVGRCLQDALDVLSLTDGNFIAVGSSLGGWIGTLLCREASDKIYAFIGLAPGIDFTKSVWENIFSDEHRLFLQNGGILGPSEETNGYCFSYDMFEDAEKYFVKGTQIDFDKPVIILHGLEDEKVPYEQTLLLSKIFTSSEIVTIFIKGSHHSLTEKKDLKILQKALDSLLEKE